jgi:putative transposase
LSPFFSEDVGAGLVPALSLAHYNSAMVVFTPRKRIRLAPEAYEAPGQAFSVTIATRERLRVFGNPDLSCACIEDLRHLKERKGNPVYAYCLMPDHAHLLIGVVRGSPLGEFIASWKSLCYLERKRLGISEPFWQRGYFDHALRSDDDLRRAALYILSNPVRGGVAKDFHQYPFCGSLEFRL